MKQTPFEFGASKGLVEGGSIYVWRTAYAGIDSLFFVVYVCVFRRRFDGETWMIMYDTILCEFSDHEDCKQGPSALYCTM